MDTFDNAGKQLKITQTSLEDTSFLFSNKQIRIASVVTLLLDHSLVALLRNPNSFHTAFVLLCYSSN